MCFCVIESVCLPLSEPGSSSASAHVLGNPERSLCPDPGSAAACCQSLCRSPSFLRQHCDTHHMSNTNIHCRAFQKEQHTHTHTHRVPAVYQYRPYLLRPRSGGCSDEGQDGQSVFWDAHVWPLGVVVMEDCVFNFPLRNLKDQKGSFDVCE